MRLAAAMGVAVVLSACASDTTPTAEAPSPATATPLEAGTSEPADSAVPAALDWSVAQLGGGQIEGGDLVGGDVVLWFWAPW